MSRTSFKFLGLSSTIRMSSFPMAHREAECERRPLTHLALDPDPPPVQLHELLGQRQPEPRALRLPRIVAPHLAELFEDRRLVLGRNPDPCVAHRDRDEVVGCRRHEANAATLR